MDNRFNYGQEFCDQKCKCGHECCFPCYLHLDPLRLENFEIRFYCYEECFVAANLVTNTMKLVEISHRKDVLFSHTLILKAFFLEFFTFLEKKFIAFLKLNSKWKILFFIYEYCSFDKYYC